MKMRPPCVPLITVDPYFSVWSPADKLTDTSTVHWTGKQNDLHGYIIIDGTKYAFLGYHRNDKKITQTSIDFDALSTKYTFENELVKLSVRFMFALSNSEPFNKVSLYSVLNALTSSKPSAFDEIIPSWFLSYFFKISLALSKMF